MENPALDAPEADPQPKKAETLISIPTDNPWATIEVLLKATGAQAVAAKAWYSEIDHTYYQKELNASQERIEHKSTSRLEVYDLIIEQLMIINFGLLH